MFTLFKKISVTSSITRISAISPITGIYKPRFIHVPSHKISSIRDQKDEVSAFILQPESDQQDKENKEAYFERSLKEFALIIKKQLSQNTQQCLFFKVNQTVIGSDSNIEQWNKLKPIPIFYVGHVTIGIFQVTKETIVLSEDTLVSKIPNKNFQSPKEIKDSLFTVATTYKRALEKGSTEYFLIIDMNKLNLTLDQYHINFSKLAKENKDFDLREAACAQSIQSVLGVKIEPKVSPQTAVRRAIFDILKEDAILKNNLLEAFDKTGFHITANELGRKLESCKENHDINKRNLKNGR